MDTARAISCRSARPWLAGVLTLLLVAGLKAPHTAAVTFSSNIEAARWQLEASVFACRLVHPIHLYGRAVFAHRAGEQQRFYLEQRNRQFREGEAQLVAFAPQWRVRPQRQSLGSVPVSLSEQPVALDWRESEQLMAQLQQGNRLAFYQRAWYGEGDPVRVVIEPVGFRPVYARFQKCLEQLLPVNYDQIARTSIDFDSNSDELDEAPMQRLDELALYVRADERVARIFVDGHTDSVGTRADNLEVSRERAEMVAQYLVDRGVDESLITTRWHGQRYPIASNRTAEGRAQNRRVTLRVDRREESPLELASLDDD